MDATGGPITEVFGLRNLATPLDQRAFNETLIILLIIIRLHAYIKLQISEFD